MWKTYFRHMFSFLLCNYLAAGLLKCMEAVCLVLQKTDNLLSEETEQLCILTRIHEISSSTSSVANLLLVFLILAILMSELWYFIVLF